MWAFVCSCLWVFTCGGTGGVKGLNGICESSFDWNAKGRGYKWGEPKEN